MPALPEFNWEPVNQVRHPLFMITFFLFGLGMSIGHVVYYVRLGGTIVGEDVEQQANLRYGFSRRHITTHVHLIIILGLELPLHSYHRSP